MDFHPYDAPTAAALGLRSGIAQRELNQAQNKENDQNIFSGINAAATFEKLNLDSQHQAAMEDVARRQEQHQAVQAQTENIKQSLESQKYANKLAAEQDFQNEIKTLTDSGVPMEKAVPQALLKHGVRMGVSPVGIGQLVRELNPPPAKPNTTVVNSFSRRVDALRKMDPDAATAFNEHVGTEPSPVINQALSLAEQAAQQHAQNATDISELGAIGRGEQPITTIRGGKAALTYRPGTSTVPDEPQTKTLEDGSTLVWRPKGNTIHIIKGETSQKITPGQLASIAAKFPDKDPRKAQLLDVAAKAALEPVATKTKVQRANQISAQHPNWSKDQVIKAVNDEFGGK